MSGMQFCFEAVRTMANFVGRCRRVCEKEQWEGELGKCLGEGMSSWKDA